MQAPRTYEPSNARLVRHRLSPQALEQLVCDYMEGMSTAAVAERYGMGVTTARGILKSKGVLRPVSKLSPEDLAAMKEMREQGTTYVEIGRRYELSKVAVRQRILALGNGLTS